MSFQVGQAIKVFTSPGTWMDVSVYAVDGEYLEVGNGDPIYHGTEIRETFRVHVSDARPIRPLETGDVVAVLSADGEVAYYGEVVSVPDPGSDAALYDRALYGIWSPDNDEIHYVASANGEGIREATEAETDAYIDRLQGQGDGDGL